MALKYKWLILLNSLVILPVMLIALQGRAEAGTGVGQQCINSTNGLSSTAAGSFPRPSSIRTMDNCGTVPLGTSHVYLSSYWAQSDDSPGSTLHTPEAIFDVFYIGTSVPNQTVSFAMNPCMIGAVWRDVYIARLNGPDIGMMGVSTGWVDTVSLPGSDFIPAPEYGSNVMKLNSPIQLYIPNDAAYNCEAYATGSATGALVTFRSDTGPYTGYGEGSQRFNQNNWNTSINRLLGPSTGNNGAVAMRTNLAATEMLEYGVRFASPCTLASAQVIRLRVYDADSPNDFTGGTNPTNTSNGTAWPLPFDASTTYDLRMRIIEYDQNGNFLQYTDPTGASNRVLAGNDVYREYAFTVQPGRQYVWHWWNVSARNGLQLWVPFSEITRTNGATCATDIAPNISFSSDCDGNRMILATDDANDPGPSDYAIERNYRIYDDATSTWGAWSGWAGIFHSPGGTDTQRIYNLNFNYDFRTYQFQFRTQGRDGDGGTPPAYVYSAAGLYGVCVRSLCDVTVPAVIYLNEPFTANLDIQNFGRNDGETWRGVNGYQLMRDDTGSTVEVDMPNTTTVAVDGFWQPNVTINPTTLGSNQFQWQMARNDVPLGGSLRRFGEVCTVTVSVRYRPPVITCQIVLPTTVEAGTTGRMQMIVTYTGPSNAAPQGTIDLAELGGNGTALRPPTSPTIPEPINRGAFITFNFDNFPFGSAALATWTGRARIWSSNGLPGGEHHPAAVPCPNRTSLVGNYPYLKEFGGDIWSGGRITNGAVCTPPAGTPGNVFGHNQVNTSGQYVGASGQLTLSVLRNIAGFGSASHRPMGGTNQTFGPKGLTFANFSTVGGSQPLTEYGGGLGDSAARCITDYYNQTQDSSIGGNGSWGGQSFPPDMGRRQYTGLNSVGSRIGASGPVTIPRGTQVAVYVDGNVFINEDIMFAEGYGVTSRIPYFALIVRGNIYIGPGVNRLDGLYIAQPNGVANSGTIYTCAVSENTPCAASNINANGGNQLSVNGSFVAHRIKFWRIPGSLRFATFGETPDFRTGAGTGAAEVFNFTPQMYLAPSPLRRPTDPDGSTGAGYYDYIRTLPPVN